MFLVCLRNKNVLDSHCHASPVSKAPCFLVQGGSLCLGMILRPSGRKLPMVGAPARVLLQVSTPASACSTMQPFYAPCSNAVVCAYYLLAVHGRTLQYAICCMLYARYYVMQPLSLVCSHGACRLKSILDMHLQHVPLLLYNKYGCW